MTDLQVAEKRKIFGPNALPEKKGRTPLSIYVSQFRNPLIYIISVAAVISLVLGEYNDALIIGLVIVLDSVLGFFQEYKAEKTVTALKHLLKPTTRVIRNGNMVEIEVTEIVPEDIIAVNPGDKIPADGELIEAVNVSTNEAILTGESEPVAKDVGDPVYMGTIISSGRGLMKASSIGVETELGKIAESLSEIKDATTPLQVRLERFGKSLTYMVIAISVLIFVIGVLFGIGFLQMLELSVVLAIAAIPEGLLIAVTMILVIGMRAILRRKGLVKKLLAVETLGSVTTICTDKTGTLTEGNMRVVRTDFRSEKMAAHVMTLCNDLADPLEVALWNHVKTMEIDPQELSAKCVRTNEVPFTSEKKYMLTLDVVEGVEVGLLKGAPEIVLGFCNLEPKEKEQVAAQFEDWANSGLKLLALAYKQEANPKELVDFTWVGLVGIEDPVRPTVKDAIALCRKAGIKVKIITGDYRGTAEKVASSIGLEVGTGRVLEGKSLENMTESELVKVVNDTVVYCRVAPDHKLKIVRALQSGGEVTAMIGDGVNDAPALKKSNIGVSVGSATDVAQETSSLILLDSDFGTLVNAVEEGRIIFENIKKVVAYTLSDSFSEIFTIFGAILLGWPAPLTIAQILWIHLICDGPSDICLGFERAERGIMDEEPKSVKESILSNSNKFLIFTISLVSAVFSLLLFWYFWKVQGNLVLGRTVVFTTIAIQDLVYVFSYRSLRLPIFKLLNFSSNKPLFGAVALGFIQQFLGLYVPFMSTILEVVPLRISDWVLVFGVALILIVIIEVVKYITNRNGKNRLNLNNSPRKIIGFSAR